MEFLAILLLLAVVIWLEGRVYRKYSFRNLKYVCYFDREEAFESPLTSRGTRSGH